MFGREITKFTVIYGVYIRFWPTLDMPVKKGGACGHRCCARHSPYYPTFLIQTRRDFSRSMLI